MRNDVKVFIGSPDMIIEKTAKFPGIMVDFVLTKILRDADLARYYSLNVCRNRRLPHIRTCLDMQDSAQEPHSTVKFFFLCAGNLPEGFTNFKSTLSSSNVNLPPESKKKQKIGFHMSTSTSEQDKSPSETSPCRSTSPSINSPTVSLKEEHQSISSSRLSNTGNNTSRKRVRTGCLNCRRKHKKCDEVKPSCTTCTSKNEVCEWPGATRSNQLPDVVLPIHYVNPPGHLHIPEIHQQSFKRQRLNMPLHLPTAQSHAFHNPQHHHHAQAIFHPYIPTGVDVPHNYQTGTPKLFPAQLSHHIEFFEGSELTPIFNNLENLLIRFLVDAEPIAVVPSPSLGSISLNAYDEIVTMKYFQQTFSPQLDSVTSNSTWFRIDVAHLTRSSNVLRNALYAVSLIHQKNDSVNPNPISLQAILSLFELSVLELTKDPQQGTITIRVMSAFFLVAFCLNIRKSERWKQLVGALLTYLQREGVHPRDRDPIRNAVYWMAIAIDINCTKVLEEATIVAHDFETLQGLNPVPRILGYLSMTFNLLQLDQPQQDFDSKWERIWLSLSNFIEELHTCKDPIFLGPIMDRADDRSPFPMVLQSSPAAVLFQQTYLVLKILLIQDRPRIFKNKYTDSHPPAWYAKRLCSITIWNKEFVNWFNTPLALVVAGKVLTHEDEHKAILNMMDDIKSKSGYKSLYGKQELLDFWEP